MTTYPNPDKTDGDILYASNIWKTFGSDQISPIGTAKGGTEVGNISIDANKVSVGILIFYSADVILDDAEEITVYINTGTSGSETKKVSVIVRADTGGGSQVKQTINLHWWEDTLTWTDAQSVTVSWEGNGAITDKSLNVIGI